MECTPCLSVAGIKRVSPGPFIYEGKYWVVDHAYPSKLIGWVVIVLKRHAEKLHELTPEEFHELGVLQSLTTKALFRELSCEKEYIVCFAEKEGFNHIHMHVVPKPPELSKELIGPGIFAMLTVNEGDLVPKEEIIGVSKKLEKIFVTELASRGEVLDAGEVSK